MRTADLAGKSSRGARWFSKIAAGGALLLALAALALNAQNYTVSSYKLAGGGGTSTGGVYSLSGTIGQHDAGGPMTGGSYSLAGGFWNVIAIQTEGAPLLSVMRSNASVILYWPLPATGFVLDQASALGATPAATVWNQVPLPYQTNATHAFVSVSPPSGTRYYRLRK
jgi:hypothetical protein